ELRDVLEAEFRKWPATELCRRLWDAGVPAGPVNSIDEVYADPQVLHREMLQEIDHPGLSRGKLRFAGFAAKLTDTPATVRRHPPMRGEHTLEILSELGFSALEVKELIAAGVVRGLRSGD